MWQGAFSPIAAKYSAKVLTIQMYHTWWKHMANHHVININVPEELFKGSVACPTFMLLCQSPRAFTRIPSHSLTSWILFVNDDTYPTLSLSTAADNRCINSWTCWRACWGHFSWLNQRERWYLIQVQPDNSSLDQTQQCSDWKWRHDTQLLLESPDTLQSSHTEGLIYISLTNLLKGFWKSVFVLICTNLHRGSDPDSKTRHTAAAVCGNCLSIKKQLVTACCYCFFFFHSE